MATPKDSEQVGTSADVEAGAPELGRPALTSGPAKPKVPLREQSREQQRDQRREQQRESREQPGEAQEPREPQPTQQASGEEERTITIALTPRQWALVDRQIERTGQSEVDWWRRFLAPHLRP